MSTPMSMGREPWADRIAEDAGMGFGVGLIGGSIYYYAKGIINSPKGHRIARGIQTTQMNAPRTAGSFAVWGALYSASDCAFTHVRGKEDPWNAIFAGAFTNGFLQLRRGLRATLYGALTGGALLAGIKGLEIFSHRMMSEAALRHQQQNLAS